jgi:TonB family protein
MVITLLLGLLFALQTSAVPPGADGIFRAQAIQSQLNDRGSSVSTRRKLIEDGLAATGQALAEVPDSVRAQLYHVAFLRQKAALTTVPTNRDISLAEAARRYRHVLQTRLAPRQPAPSSSPDLSAAVFGESFAETARRLSPMRGTPEFYPRPTTLFEVLPVYPPEERAERKQEVVVEAIINTVGDVVNARLLRSAKGLDRPALEAVSLRSFTPPIFHGRAVAFFMAMTVPSPRG